MVWKFCNGISLLYNSGTQCTKLLSCQLFLKITYGRIIYLGKSDPTLFEGSDVISFSSNGIACDFPVVSGQ
jgi:hypothetical protein